MNTTTPTPTTAPRRLYLVTAQSGQQHLVSASHPSHALAHIARAEFSVTVPNALTVAALVTAGLTVKEA